MLDRVVRDRMPGVLIEAAAWERTRALDASGNAAAGRALADFVARHSRSDHVDAARLALARRALQAGDAGAVRAQVDAVLRGRPSRLDRAEARLLRAGAEAGRATRVDRILLIAPNETGRRRALAGISVPVDWSWPPRSPAVR